MAIVDAFEAMTTTQFYREPKSVDAAAVTLRPAAGKSTILH